MNLPRIPFLSILFYILILGFIFWVAHIFFTLAQETPLQSERTQKDQAAAVTITLPEEAPAETRAPNEPLVTPTTAIQEPPQTNDAPVSTHDVAEEAIPIATPKEPYFITPLSFDIIHTATVPSIVNILCAPKNGAPYSGATGTGVLIDPRGIVLTNAHLGQYFVLKDVPEKDSLRCVLRTGSPAKSAFYADVLLFPNAWAQEHPGEFNNPLATGTGEHDWTLLYITEAAPEFARTHFSFITPDTRTSITDIGDSVFIAGYPAGFLDSELIKRSLWPVSTIATVRTLFTFRENTPDLFSVGGTIVAQGGTSGSPAVNAWGRLVGIAVTASEGATTDERDLRFVTLSHIDTDIQRQTGLTLAEFIAGDLHERAQSFYTTEHELMVSLLTR